MVLTDQLVASGQRLLDKYKVVETIEPYIKHAQQVTTTQGMYIRFYKYILGSLLRASFFVGSKVSFIPESAGIRQKVSSE
jgi:hypothetical protein